MSRSNIPGYCYLIHFEEPYEHARHYLGWSENLASRIAAHEEGNGSNLMRVITEAGIDWRVVRIWRGATRYDERRLKKLGGHGRLCPECRPSSNAGASVPSVVGAELTKLLKQITGGQTP